MNREKTKAVREGAMMVALTVIFILLTWYMPLFSMVGVFVCGVPMAALAARNGFKAAIPAIFCVFIISSIVTGSIPSSLSMVFMYIIPGTVAGFFLGKEKPFFQTLFAVCFSVCMGWLIELVLIDTLMGGEGVEGMIKEMMTQMKSAFSMVFEKLPAADGGNDNKEIMSTVFEMLENTLRLYFPALIIVSSMLIGYIMIRISGFVFKRIKIRSSEVLPFSMMKAPKSMGYVLMGLYVVSMFMKEQTVLASVIANAAFVLMVIVGVSGLSFLDYKLSDKIKQSSVRGLIYAAVFLFGGVFMTLAMNALVIVGIFDSLHNYRRINIE